jgi:AraC family transcriptional regulator
MDCLSLTGGLYAVFYYRGSSADPSIFQYIYGEWIPKSHYQLDDRPHFEVLGTNYKSNDPTSEEEIWIPICKK